MYPEIGGRERANSQTLAQEGAEFTLVSFDFT